MCSTPTFTPTISTRKRGRQPKVEADEELDIDQLVDQDQTSSNLIEQDHSPSPSRKRGRPSKIETADKKVPSKVVEKEEKRPTKAEILEKSDLTDQDIDELLADDLIASEQDLPEAQNNPTTPTQSRKRGRPSKAAKADAAVKKTKEPEPKKEPDDLDTKSPEKSEKTPKKRTRHETSEQSEDESPKR